MHGRISLNAYASDDSVNFLPHVVWEKDPSMILIPTFLQSTDDKSKVVPLHFCVSVQMSMMGIS